MSKSVLAWHFVGERLRDGQPVPADGEVLRHTGKLVMCPSLAQVSRGEGGLHASCRIIDALRYAPGSTICRVRVSGKIIEGDDKLVASERVILWRVDGDALLREFARDCALGVLHLWGREEIPGIDTVAEWLLTGDESLRAAAWDAAWDAAGAGDAARAAARAAAWAAAGDAAGAAAGAAGAAARDAHNTRLTRMAMAAHRRWPRE